MSVVRRAAHFARVPDVAVIPAVAVHSALPISTHPAPSIADHGTRRFDARKLAANQPPRIPQRPAQPRGRAGAARRHPGQQRGLLPGLRFPEPRHFFEPLHQQIFELAADLIRAGKIATPVTLKTFLPADDDDRRARRSASISRGSRPRRPPSSTPRTMAAPIYDLAMRRKLITHRRGHGQRSPSTRRSISRRASRSRTPSGGSSSSPRPARYGRRLPALRRRRSPTAVDMAGARLSARRPALRHRHRACATSTRRWAACSPPT